MAVNFKPLLSPQEDPLSCRSFFEQLQYPMLVSPKIDGIRGVVKNNCLMSRSFKPLANQQIQERFTSVNHVDGELTYGEPTGHDVLNRASSAVRAKAVTGDFRYYLFDYTEDLRMPYHERLEALAYLAPPEAIILKHEYVENLAQLLEVETAYLDAGYEGAMLRNPVAEYKCGRATMRDAIIWKLKRFQDEEFELAEVLPALRNENTLTTDALGYAERSTHKENLVETDIAGTYIFKDIFGALFPVSPGMLDHGTRRQHLLRPPIGAFFTVRSFGRTPAGALRHPRIVSERID